MEDKQYVPTTPAEIAQAENFIGALCEVSTSNTTNLMRGYLVQDDPESAMGILVSVVSLPLARLPDDEWKRIRRDGAKPCGKPGCDCHHLKASFLDACGKLRDKQKEANALPRGVQVRQGMPVRRTDG